MAFEMFYEMEMYFLHFSVPGFLHLHGGHLSILGMIFYLFPSGVLRGVQFLVSRLSQSIVG